MNEKGSQQLCISSRYLISTVDVIDPIGGRDVLVRSCGIRQMHMTLSRDMER